MRLLLITDAWAPQVNGVVTTLVELVRELGQLGTAVEVIHPAMFRTRPCPGYAGIDIAMRPGPEMARRIQAATADAIHIATEGPLGWAARGYCMRHGLAFTTAFHTRFPEILQAALRLPLALGYALFRHFHKPSAGVMVPTQGVLEMLRGRGFANLRSWTHGVDTTLFSYQPEPRVLASLGALARPVSLFVGRVSYEKNIDAFLALDIPGTRIVCGVGPLESTLKERFPQVRWLGLLPRDELAMVYAAADVFVFPSKHETFGLVMLEAMACGTPVAAYPENGPTEVLATGQGGCLHADLRSAFFCALAIPRHEARARALEFGWAQAARQFAANLVPAHRNQALPQLVTRLS